MKSLALGNFTTLKFQVHFVSLQQLVPLHKSDWSLKLNEITYLFKKDLTVYTATNYGEDIRVIGNDKEINK